jgi:trans-aconitate methyltransferase
VSEYEYDHRYTRYQADRGSFRKAVRRVYLSKAQSYVTGPTLDLGCGIGELLSRLPAGSKGLEYNRDTVAHCVARGLDVEWYDGFADDWSLSAVEEGRFISMVISHVLEHLREPMTILRKVLGAAEHRGVTRVLVIVPGKAGYASDRTHVTFVDREMLQAAVKDSTWRVDHAQYFPGNFRGIGDRFAYHELQMLLVPQGIGA